MVGYYDMHCHILPGIDDGAKDMDMTKEMLKIAYEEGIRHIVCTPHYILGNNSADRKKIEAVIEEVQLEASKIGDGIKLYPGNEIYYTEGVLEKVINKEAMTLNNSRYVLLEFSVQDKYNRIYAACKEFTNKGYIPVLAHVERYREIFKKTDKIKELIAAGALIQVNCSSFLGGLFDDTAGFCKKLAAADMVHILGTDAHRNIGRAPYMNKSVDVIYKKCGLDTVKQLVKINPKGIILNQLID